MSVPMTLSDLERPRRQFFVTEIQTQKPKINEIDQFQQAPLGGRRQEYVNTNTAVSEEVTVM